MTLWFDVEDLIVFFQRESRPTGIQRLSFEIYREVWALAGATGQVRFCRHGATEADYIVVDWPSLEAGILLASAGQAQSVPVAGRQDLIAAAPPEAAAVEPREGTAAPPRNTIRLQPSHKHALEPLPEPAEPGAAEALPEAEAEFVPLNLKGRIHRYLFPRITPSIRIPLGLIYRSQKQTVLGILELFKALTAAAASPGEAPAKLGEVTIRLSTEQAEFAAGDIFISLGASWGSFNAAAGRHVQERYGLRFAVFIHDLIPELYPEWTSKEGLPSYRAWLREVVPRADVIFANSQHTAADLLRRMAEWDKQVPVPVVLPIGYSPLRRQDAALAEKPFDRPFVLFVSTIEVRKNHALLFRVWRLLLETLPEAAVPYLVFAGKTGWLTADLFVQLENADWLDGHIKWVESPSEPELAALYEACEFTVFPSLYEGWGLPITESLSFGKTVAASQRAAIPEAGGAFCTYFDPENVADAYSAIRGLIENPERVRQLEARIAADFRSPAWAETAAALLEALHPLEQPGLKASVRIKAAA